MAEVKCYLCGGAGVYSALVHFTAGHCKPQVLRCDTCDGTGMVSQAQKDSYEEGRRRRTLRVNARVTQKALARQMGIPPAIYSQMELGLTPWPMGSEMLFAALEREG